jgi:hypothetical protein
MDSTSRKKSGAEGPLLPQAAVVEKIHGALGRGYRRLLVLGPVGSRRLGLVRQALAAWKYNVIVFDLSSVHSRWGLDAMARRAAMGANFADAVWKLERQALRRRLAVVFHNFYGCRDSSDESRVVDAVWMAARGLSGSAIMILTARDSNFVARCFEQFPDDRTFVYPINLEGGTLGRAPGGHIVKTSNR